MRKLIASIQWFLFIVSSSIVVPVSVGALYGISGQDSIDFVSRTFFVLALTGLLQVAFGHKLPINEGPAGLWWGFFILYAGIGKTLYGSAHETLKVMEFSLIISGIIAILMTALGLVNRLSKLFTSTVIGTYLILLIVQLSGSFLNGMLGVTSNGAVSLKIVFVSAFTAVLSFALGRSKMLGQFSIIISLGAGWALYSILNLGSGAIAKTEHVFQLPSMFVFGGPRIEPGMLPIIFLITILLITNMIASIKVVEKVVQPHTETPLKPSSMKAGITMGISQMLGGLFSTMGTVAISGAAGFIQTNKVFTKGPFIIGSGLVLAASLFSPIMAFFSTLPVAVGYAAILPVYVEILTLGLKELFHSQDAETVIKKAAIPLFTGIGLMFIPLNSFSVLPPLAVTLLSNGLVVGTLIALAMEVFTRKKAITDKETA
ncbi:purine permease [Neobacillus piezotolerans]|uniref:Purine permease n=1 Tax=Neobacillus piezotolerans TaxID=2259171 RepID=A0A3D8GRE7_9BACI|nr:purine/pyrimidine permease [Neobacillus piezotolerans]RDU36789.1 purine permease [Neobacillus piezotolerans]